MSWITWIWIRLVYKFEEKNWKLSIFYWGRNRCHCFLCVKGLPLCNSSVRALQCPLSTWKLAHASKALLPPLSTYCALTKLIFSYIGDYLGESPFQPFVIQLSFNVREACNKSCFLVLGIWHLSWSRWTSFWCQRPKDPRPSVDNFGDAICPLLWPNSLVFSSFLNYAEEIMSLGV